MGRSIIIINNMCQHDIEANGWTAVPVDAGKIFGDKPFLHEPAPISVQDIQFPSDDPIIAKTLGYAKDRLHAQTFNHSMRVFYYGTFSDRHITTC